MTPALWRIATPIDAGAIHPIRTADIGTDCSEPLLSAHIVGEITSSFLFQ